MAIVTCLALTAVLLVHTQEMDKPQEVVRPQETKKETCVRDVNRIKKVEIPAQIEETEEPEEILVSLGEFRLTAYCGCSKCCGKWASKRPVDSNGKPIVIGASGYTLKEGTSIAVDTSIIPYGTTVMINGHEYVAHDTGGAIKGNRIDVYFANHDSARQFAVQCAEVFVLERRCD